jgi:hypothetical protein
MVWPLLGSVSTYGSISSKSSRILLNSVGFTPGIKLEVEDEDELDAAEADPVPDGFPSGLLIADCKSVEGLTSESRVRNREVRDEDLTKRKDQF